MPFVYNDNDTSLAISIPFFFIHPFSSGSVTLHDDLFAKQITNLCVCVCFSSVALSPLHNIPFKADRFLHTQWLLI